MRKRLRVMLSFMCLLTILTACTDNGDDTPVEAKADKDNLGKESMNSFDDLLHEV